MGKEGRISISTLTIKVLGGGVFSNNTVAMRRRGIETVKRVSVVFDTIQLDVATMLIRSIWLVCFVFQMQVML